MSEPDRIFRYVLLDEISAYETVGWRVVPGMPHPVLDVYCVVMELVDDCEMDLPKAAGQD